MRRLATRNYTAHFIREDLGGFSVVVPALPGCNTQGETFEEAYRNTQDAIQLYLRSLAAHGEPTPIEGETAVAQIAIAVPQPARVRDV